MGEEFKIKELLKKNQFDDADFIRFIRYHSLQHWYYIKYFEKQTNKKEFLSSKLYEELIKVKQSNLLLYSEWKSIWNTAKRSNIHLFLYKGLALSKQLYGDALIRANRDLDVFVEFNNISEVHEILLSLGYKRIKPDFDLNEVQLKQIKNHLHHFSYFHASKNVLVELHWQLFVPSTLMKSGEILFENILNEMSEDGLHSFKPEILLHYLMVHAAMHHWFKLNWLADMDTLIRSNTINWNEFETFSVVFKNERMVHVSYKLLVTLFDTPIPYNNRLSSVEKNIYNIALRSIFEMKNILTLKGIKRVKRAFYLSILKKSCLYKFQCWYAPMTNVEDWKSLPLPKYLYGVYIIFRPFLWLYHNYLKKK